MKNEKGISLIALLILTIVLFGILGFKIISNKKINTGNISTQNTPDTNINTENKTPSNTTGLGKEFKQAMDSYEQFMDEYISFMKKYTNSNVKTSQMFIDYGEYMKKYVDMVDAFEKWENNNLNNEEAKYYIEVQMRVSQKLINASIDVQYH